MLERGYEAELVHELISRYGLEEDLEHVIIPFTGSSGSVKRCFILKRRFIRVVYPDKHYSDYPLHDVVEATVKYPELLLSEALRVLHREKEPQTLMTDEPGTDEKETEKE
ncbi:MAG: hypothetical protein ACOYW7_14550 [Nitrospirota bacterium]